MTRIIKVFQLLCVFTCIPCDSFVSSPCSSALHPAEPEHRPSKAPAQPQQGPAWDVTGCAVFGSHAPSIDHAGVLQVAAVQRTRALQQRADAFRWATRACPVMAGWLQCCREGRADAHARARRGLRCLHAWQAQVGDL